MSEHIEETQGVEQPAQEGAATEERQMKFEDFKLNKQLLTAIKQMGYEHPSPIQAQAIPMALAGHDILGIAQTGTGKTAAYLLPILMKLKYPQGDAPRALILAPTRELAIQIDKEIAKIGKYTGLRHTAVYGGTGMKPQIEAIENGIDILVGTPGRVMDIYLKHVLVVKQIKVMVLDEADRIMDMGFMPQIRRMLEIVPRKRQNMLFSATMHDVVVRLTQEFLDFPQRIEITPQATTAEMVEQYVYKVPNLRTKINMLYHLLTEQAETFQKVIIFTKRREHADNIFRFLDRKIDKPIRVIHANKGQNTRINALDAFKQGEADVLVATDVAARGIDVSQVSHVINFDVPVLYDDYVHRVGRTGRANNSGVAITFCNPAEEYHLGKIQELIRMQVPEVEMPEEVEVLPTEFEEKQEQARAIDAQKRKEDPTFKGAFHDKKDKALKKAEKTKKKQQGKKQEQGRKTGKSSVFVSSKERSKKSGSSPRSGR